MIGTAAGDGRETTQRLWALVDAGIALSSDLELEGLLRRIVRLSTRVIGAKYGALGVLNAERTGLAHFVFHGISRREADRIGNLPVGRGLLGALISDPRPIRLERLQSDPRSSGFPDNHPPMHSFLGVPVLSRGRVFGNLYLTEKRGGAAFTEEDEQLAVAFAGQAGVAVENARLYQEARESESTALRRLEALQTVQELGTAVLSETNPAHVLRVIATRARDLVQADSALVALVEPDGELFRVELAVGRGARAVHGARMPVARSLSGRALTTGEVTVVDDAREEAGAHVPIALALDARSALFAPLEERGQRVGVLALAHRQPARFGAEQIFLVRSFADLASLAMRNARLLEQERQRAEAEAELAGAQVREEMRAELLRRVIVAQEAERGRVSRDLHDSAGQAVASMLLGLKVAEQQPTLPQVKARLADLREIASQAAAELRRLALELRPTVLDDLGLEAAVERYLRDFQRRSGVRVTADLELGERRLDPEAETVLYRVLQESLTNVAKYAEASAVRVRLEERNGAIRLRVRDNGRGFDPGDAAETGLGLRGMQERAELVDGKLRIESAPGRGTTVELEVPAG